MKESIIAKRFIEKARNNVPSKNVREAESYLQSQFGLQRASGQFRGQRNSSMTFSATRSEVRTIIDFMASQSDWNQNSISGGSEFTKDKVSISVAYDKGQGYVNVSGNIR